MGTLSAINEGHARMAASQRLSTGMLERGSSCVQPCRKGGSLASGCCHECGAHYRVPGSNGLFEVQLTQGDVSPGLEKPDWEEGCDHCGDTFPDGAYHECPKAPGLPTDAAARKAIPIYSGFIKYFPKAMAAVAELSRIGNDQHNPGKPLHWDRSKSGDELDALMRHVMEAGTTDTDGVLHSAKAAWRAMANLEKEIENA